MYVGVFDELVVVDLRLHLRLLAEEVVRAVDLSRSRLSSGVAHGESETPRKIFPQHVDQGALRLRYIYIYIYNRCSSCLSYSLCRSSGVRFIFLKKVFIARPCPVLCFRPLTDVLYIAFFSSGVRYTSLVPQFLISGCPLLYSVGLDWVELCCSSGVRYIRFGTLAYRFSEFSGYFLGWFGVLAKSGP